MQHRIKFATAAVAIALLAPVTQSNFQAHAGGFINGGNRTCWHNDVPYAVIGSFGSCPLSSHDSHFVLPGKIGVPKDEPGEHCFYEETDENSDPE